MCFATQATRSLTALYVPGFEMHDSYCFASSPAHGDVQRALVPCRPARVFGAHLVANVAVLQPAAAAPVCAPVETHAARHMSSKPENATADLPNLSLP